MSEPLEAARDDLAHAVRHAPRSPRRSRYPLRSSDVRTISPRKNGLPFVSRWSTSPSTAATPRAFASVSQRAQCAGERPSRRILLVEGSRASRDSVAKNGWSGWASVSRYVATTTRRMSVSVAATNSSSSIDDGSAQWTSSSTTTSPAGRVSAPRNWLAMSRSRNRSLAPLSLGASAGSQSRSTGNTCASSAHPRAGGSRDGFVAHAVHPSPERRVPRPEGGGSPCSQPRPHHTGTPRASASSPSTVARRVLPIPGSPPSRTRRPSPPSAASSAPRSSSTSRSRPMSGMAGVVGRVRGLGSRWTVDSGSGRTSRIRAEPSARSGFPPSGAVMSAGSVGRQRPAISMVWGNVVLQGRLWGMPSADKDAPAFGRYCDHSRAVRSVPENRPVFRRLQPRRSRGTAGARSGRGGRRRPRGDGSWARSGPVASRAGSPRTA